MYINGHFCYADKFAILTNVLGIVRHISFLDDVSFKAAPPELIVEKKSDSPDEDMSIGDASSLAPVLSDFFSLNPEFHPDTFLGDSVFDSAELYGISCKTPWLKKSHHRNRKNDSYSYLPDAVYW